jgi:hypothetical protein
MTLNQLLMWFNVEWNMILYGELGRAWEERDGHIWNYSSYIRLEGLRRTTSNLSQDPWSPTAIRTGHTSDNIPMCRYVCPLGNKSNHTECRGRVVSTPSSYSGCPGFKCLPKDRLPCVKFSWFLPLGQWFPNGVSRGTTRCVAKLKKNI